MVRQARRGEFQGDADVGGGWAVGGKGYVEGGGVLGEFQVLIVAEQRGAGDLWWILRAAGAEGRDDGGAFGPALNEGVDGGAFGGEADVGGGEVGLLAFVGVELLAVFWMTTLVEGPSP